MVPLPNFQSCGCYMSLSLVSLGHFSLQLKHTPLCREKNHYKVFHSTIGFSKTRNNKGIVFLSFLRTTLCCSRGHKLYGWALSAHQYTWQLHTKEKKLLQACKLGGTLSHSDPPCLIALYYLGIRNNLLGYKTLSSYKK